MNIQNHFYFVAQVIKNLSTYSQAKKAWMISVPHLRAVLNQHPVNRPPEQLTLDDMLKEGVRRGLWKMDYGEEIDSDIVLLR